MKAALIPPVQMLPRFGNGSFHLLLSHLLANRKYRDHYRIKRQQGAYLVLDNSAHENGEGNDPNLLMYQAEKLDAQEVVVPDALDDADRTIEGAIAAHEAWFETPREGRSFAKERALMYVPQGKNYEDWNFCLRNLVNIHLFSSRTLGIRQDFVIGISKDYEVWDGGLMQLLDSDILPLKRKLGTQGIRVNVHMLGWGRNLWALKVIADIHKWIRSTDSAKPFVYAINGTILDPSHEAPVYPKRPENYFDRKMSAPQIIAADVNSRIFRSIAAGSRVNRLVV